MKYTKSLAALLVAVMLSANAIFAQQPTATASPGTRDIVTDGIDGLLVEAHTAGAVAERLQRVLGDPSSLAGLRAGAAQSAEKFGLRTAVARYDAVMSAVRHLNGEKVEKIQSLAPRLVTLEDLNKPEVQAQLNPDIRQYLD